jgi:holo-[acyl-carrier protein] synthase
VILGIGLDLCPIERMEGIIDRHGEIFCKRVFTDRERAYADQGARPAERYAARFAAKEAAIKALGGPEGILWKEMEVERQKNGAPTLKLHGRARTRAESMGVTRALVSLTHAGGMASAVVILEGVDHVE